MKNIYRSGLLICLSTVLFGSLAFAMPSAGKTNEDKSFSSMDKDHDGKVTREEFFARFPDMKDAAFDAVDEEKKGYITEENWNKFRGVHGKDNSVHMPPSAPDTAGNETQKDDVPDLIPPASK